MEDRLFKTFMTLSDTVNDSHEDFAKFQGGNKSAGTRIRKRMQEVKILAQRVRVQVQEEKNAVTA